MVTLLPQLMNAAYVKQIISQSFQSIILMTVCLIMYLVATIVEKSGWSTGLVIDTYFLHSYLNVNTRVGSSAVISVRKGAGTTYILNYIRIHRL
jgi:hypothetical protein